MTLAIEVEDLQFSWDRRQPPVLEMAEFRVDAGERLFLKGPSGSGKTTLLNILGGVMVPQAGTVRVAGTELTALGSAARDRFRADRIGFVFQLFNLVPYLGLVENVALPCRFSARRRAEAESAGGIEAEAVRLLTRMGLDPAALGARPVATLSVGQQQRVAAARALIGSPALIVADEPTSALDEDVALAFLDLVLGEAAAAGATVLFVSHDARLEAAFDRTVALRDLTRVAA